MAGRRTDRSAAEVAVAGIERLIDAGDEQAARFSLELLGPSFRTIADDDQIRRLDAVAETLGMPGLGLADAEDASQPRGP